MNNILCWNIPACWFFPEVGCSQESIDVELLQNTKKMAILVEPRNISISKSYVVQKTSIYWFLSLWHSEMFGRVLPPPVYSVVAFYVFCLSIPGHACCCSICIQYCTARGTMPRRKLCTATLDPTNFLELSTQTTIYIFLKNLSAKKNW